MKCLVCGAHVATGNALIVLEGDLHGDGTFTAQEVVGVLCLDCGNPDAKQGQKFPFTFKVGL